MHFRQLTGECSSAARRAPESAAAAYARRMAAVVAGADSNLAAALDAAPEPAEADWDAVQATLAGDILHPREVAEGDPEALETLHSSLARADRAAESSPAAAALAEGSESAVADVLALSGVRAARGCLQGFGALCVLAAQTELFSGRFSVSEIEEAASGASAAGREAAAEALFPSGPLRERALAAVRAKAPSPDGLRNRLALAAARWDRIGEALDAQLMHWPRMRAMLAAAGAPDSPAALGITPVRAAAAVLAAPLLMPRYGVLDLAFETGRLERCASAVASRWHQAAEG